MDWRRESNRDIPKLSFMPVRMCNVKKDELLNRHAIAITQFMNTQKDTVGKAGRMKGRPKSVNTIMPSESSTCSDISTDLRSGC